jgi:hypothetical protein
MNSLNLFGGGQTLRPNAMQTPIGALADSLRSSVSGQGGGFADGSVVKAAMSLESYSNDTQAQLLTSVQNLRATIASAVKSVPGLESLTLAQESAAIAAGIMSSSVKDALRAPIHGLAKLKAMAGENGMISVVGNSGQDGAMDVRQKNLSLEAYDEKENRNAIAYSVAYNMQAARQDEFGEAFFPTVVVTPDNVGFMVSIRLHYVQEEVRRSLSGSVSDFGRKNILKAVVDPTILRNDQTLLMPIVRTGGGSNDSTVNFVDPADVAPYSVNFDRQVVTTAPLKIGKKFDLLAISQNEALIAAGVLDQTDAIDSSVRLGAIYVKLATGGTMKFSTKDIPTSDFNAAVQGNTRMLSLNFNTDALKVTAEKTKVDGSAITALASLADNTVRLSATVFGTVVQDRAETILNSGEVTCHTVTDVNGIVLGQTTGVGKTISDLFIGAKVIGYDLIGHRTNSNRRQRGQQVDTQFINNLYTVPLLPPVTALRPVGETEANDSALLASLITTTKIRTSNAAVTALLEARDILKDFVNSADDTHNQPAILGVAREVVTAQYHEFILDAVAQLDSLTSTDRAQDLQSLLINKIRDMAFRMYTGSAYKAAADAIFDGAAPKPMLIIGTDPIIARYLTLTGDTRTLGDSFDFKLVSTLDQRMRGKVIFSFGMENAYSSGVPNPLHFGNMAWKPEMTLVMPIPRNGAISNELTVSPSFRHIVNLPILAYMEINGIEQIIADKVNINVANTLPLVP